MLSLYRFPVGGPNPPWKFKPFNAPLMKSQDGQLIVEYVLLLLVALSIAFTIRATLVKVGEQTDASDSGAIIQQWKSLEDSIGEDDPNLHK